MRTPVLIIGLTSLLLLGGCLIGSDAKGIAHELKTLRETYVGDGLLSPTTEDDRVAYRTELLTFRTRIRESGGLDQGTLNDYVDGSLSLLSLHESLREGNTALETASSTPYDCTPNGYAGRALAHYQDAKEENQSAHDSFQRVIGNANIANEVGVSYIQNVLTTTRAGMIAYTARIDEIKTTCGPTI
ncbi:MAG: hypothetical protein AABW68_02365 [archaeon]